MRTLLAMACIMSPIFAADVLESISADGVIIPAATLSQLSGLKPGDRVDEAAFGAAVEKLQQTGLFRAVTFRYQPGPKKTGIAAQFHFDLAPPVVATLIDIPGVKEPDAWA